MNEFPEIASPADSIMYKEYANYYDRFFEAKDYEKESAFLHQLLSKYQVKTLLDIGCGTGTHLANLEKYGYRARGIDLNPDMLACAANKVKSQIAQADMRDFDLGCQFDAIVSMFAVFNHNLTIENAQKTLRQAKAHLNHQGVLILDLYNPQSPGQKINQCGEVTRVMQWQLDPETQVCNSIVNIMEGNKMYESTFPLKVYSISLIKSLLQEVGFGNILFYGDYTFLEGTSSSRNVIVVAQKLLQAAV
jgi:SAM-dependent methyltransferase